MPNETPQLLRSAPYFPVADLERSADHYERVLGFRREYVGGKPPQFAIVSRDGFSIMLRRVPEPENIRPNEKQGGTWDAFFWVRDARALHEELRANGADVVYGPIVQEEYRMEEFAVRDREGYVLGFGQSLERRDAETQRRREGIGEGTQRRQGAGRKGRLLTRVTASRRRTAAPSRSGRPLRQSG